VNDATGEITLSADSHIAIYDGPAEGASFRTKLATAAYGWRGDGTQQIMVRLRPTSNPGATTKPMIMVGLVDSGGDVTSGTTGIAAAGFGFTSATEFGWSYSNVKADGATSGAEGWGGTETALVTLAPVGLIGDDTNGAGAREGTVGGFLVAIRPAANDYRYHTGTTASGSVTGAVYLELFVSFDAAGGADDVATTLTFILEWCIVQVLPTNEWVV